MKHATRGHLEVLLLQLVLLLPGALAFWNCRARHCREEDMLRHGQALGSGMAQELVSKPGPYAVTNHLYTN